MMKKEEKEPEEERNPPFASAAIRVPFCTSAASELAASSSQLRLLPDCCCICWRKDSRLLFFPSNGRIFEQREWIAVLNLCAETAARLLKRHRLDIANGSQPRWCLTCAGASASKFQGTPGGGYRAQMQNYWSNGGCFICNSGLFALHFFPGNANAILQKHWVGRLNLPPSQTESLLIAHQEALKQGIHPRWCRVHFTGANDSLPKDVAKEREEDKQIRAMIRNFGYGTTSHPLPPTRCCCCNENFSDTPTLEKHLKQRTCFSRILSHRVTKPPSDTNNQSGSQFLHGGSAAESRLKPVTVPLDRATVHLLNPTTAPLELRPNECCICCKETPELYLFPTLHFQQQSWMEELKLSEDEAAILLARHRLSLLRRARPGWCASCKGNASGPLMKIEPALRHEPMLSEEQQLEEITRRQKEALRRLQKRHRETVAEVNKTICALRDPPLKGRPISPEERTHWGGVQSLDRETRGKHETKLRYHIARPDNFFEYRDDEVAPAKTEHVKKEEIGEEFLEDSGKEKEGSRSKRSRLTASGSTHQSRYAESLILNHCGETSAVKTEPVDVKEEDMREQLLICLNHTEEVEEGWNGRGMEVNWEGEQKMKEEEDLSVYNPPLFFPFDKAIEAEATKGEMTEVKEEREDEDSMPIKQFLHRSLQKD